MIARALVPAILIGALAQAHAQAAADAEILFRNGKRLLKQGKVAEACAAFDASQKLEPTISTVLNQANCREKNHQLATAWGLFLDAERDTRSATDDAGRQLHQIATDHADKLESRLSTLEIHVAADARVDGLEIRRDGVVIDAATWNQALPIDGGTYTIAARAPGGTAWTTKVTVAEERDAKTIEIPKPAVATPARASTTTPTPVHPRVEPVPPPAQTTIAAPQAWFCTGSRFVKVGTCKTTREACEAFRDRTLAHVQDLGECAPAQTATCFLLANEPHCTPSEDACDAMRDAASHAAGASPGACTAVRATATLQAQKPAPTKATGQVAAAQDLDEGGGWSCTESERWSIGSCKPTPAACESFRSALLERYPDLSECHASSASCFDIGKEPHCAPSAPLCEAQRTTAAKQTGKKLGACYAKQAP
jgi:hypothetical protein